MRTGRIEANLPILNAEYRLPFVPDLIQRKVSTKEKATIEDADLDFHAGEFSRLLARLQAESEASRLPEEPSTRAALERAVIEARLGHLRR